MTFDIRTLAMILGIISLLQVIIFAFHATINRTSQEARWWLLWSGTAAVAFVFVLLRPIPSLYHISIIAQNILITLALTFLYIGMMRFLGVSVRRELIITFLSVFIAVQIYFTYVVDNIAIRTIEISVTWAVIAFIIAHSLFLHKRRAINASATFLAIAFIVHGCLFLFRASLVLIGVNVADFFTPSLFNVSALLDGIIVSTLWTCGIIIMVNQQANADIEEAKSHFESIFNTSPDAVLITSLTDGIIVNVNDGFTALTGFARDEVIGKSSLDVPIWENPTMRLQVITALTERGSCENFETKFIRKNGSQVIGNLSATILMIDDIPYIISVTRDITESKQTEASLRKALEDIQVLRGILPICMHCKKIRDDHGYWSQVEVYIRNHTEAEFSHGICPECIDKYYP